MSATVVAAYAAPNPGRARIGLDNALERATVLESRRVSTGSDNEAAAFPVVNVTRRNTHETWRPTSFSPKVVAEWASPVTVNYLAVARHNIGSAGITGGSLWVTPAGAETGVLSLDFSDDSDLVNWSRGLNSVDGAFTITAGVLRYTKGAGDSDLPRIVRALTTVAGRAYRLKTPALGGTASFRDFFVTTASNGSDSNAISTTAQNGALDISFVAPGTTVYLVLRERGVGTGTGFTAEIASVEITEGIAKVLDFAPTTDQPFMIPFAATSIERAEVRFGTGADAIVAVIHLGQAVIMPRPLRATMQPVFLSRQTSVENQTSDGGEHLGSIVTRKGSAVSPQWSNLSRAFYNDTLRPLAETMPGKALFLQWQPEEHPAEVVYGVASGDPSGDHIARSSRYSFGFAMQGAAL